MRRRSRSSPSSRTPSTAHGHSSRTARLLRHPTLSDDAGEGWGDLPPIPSPRCPAGIEDLAEIGDVLGEGAAPRGCGLDASLRLLADKKFLDGDIARALERIEMRAEIAIGGADQPLQAREFERRLRMQHIERRHDLEPHRLMDGLVRTVHRDQPIRHSHRPLAIKPPPTDTASQSGYHGPLQT